METITFIEVWKSERLNNKTSSAFPKTSDPPTTTRQAPSATDFGFNFAFWWREELRRRQGSPQSCPAAPSSPAQSHQCLAPTPRAGSGLRITSCRHQGSAPCWPFARPPSPPPPGAPQNREHPKNLRRKPPAQPGGPFPSPRTVFLRSDPKKLLDPLSVTISLSGATRVGPRVSPGGLGEPPQHLPASQNLKRNKKSKRYKLLLKLFVKHLVVFFLQHVLNNPLPGPPPDVFPKLGGGSVPAGPNPAVNWEVGEGGKRGRERDFVLSQLRGLLARK